MATAHAHLHAHLVEVEHRSGHPEPFDAAHTGKASYTCPMHPEIVRDAAGGCPICGMALEPRTATGDDDAAHAELTGMARRFWISVGRLDTTDGRRLMDHTKEARELDGEVPYDADDEAEADGLHASEGHADAAAQGRFMSCCSDIMKPIEASSCCAPKETAADEARAMRTSGCGCALVAEDTKERELVGVVTGRSVGCGAAAEDRRPSQARVDEMGDRMVQITRRAAIEAGAASDPK